jgi:hypothetical protein
MRELFPTERKHKPVIVVTPITRRQGRPHTIKKCVSCKDDLGFDKYIDLLSPEGKMARENTDGSYSCNTCVRNEIIDKRIKYATPGSQAAADAYRKKFAMFREKADRKGRINKMLENARRIKALEKQQRR